MKILVLSALLVLAAPALAVEPHSQEGPVSAHELALDHGGKWATDAALREGMEAIRAALAQRRPALVKGTLGEAEYAELGEAIEKNVASIVANCRLSPEADANLHVVIAQLADAAGAMKGPSPMGRAEGAQKAMAALDLYGRYFEHPGWKPLA